MRITEAAGDDHDFSCALINSWVARRADRGKDQKPSALPEATDDQRHTSAEAFHYLFSSHLQMCLTRTETPTHVETEESADKVDCFENKDADFLSLHNIKHTCVQYDLRRERVADANSLEQRSTVYSTTVRFWPMREGEV